jgi:GNAT superfamily N-acetyltransferase
VAPHLDDRLALPVHDPHGLRAEDLRVRVAQELLGVLPGDLPERGAATSGDHAGTETDREDAADAFHPLVIRRRAEAVTPGVDRDWATVVRVEISDEIRRLAVDPFGELPTPREVELVALEGAVLGINPWPGAQIVRPVGIEAGQVAATVAQARAAGRDRGKRVLAWWITSEYDEIAAALEAAGLVNTDTPGFEAVENGMALVSPPTGRAAEDVQIGIVTEWEEYAEAGEVTRAVFDLPRVAEEELRQRYTEYLAALDLGVTLCARIDDRIVGTSHAAYGTAGINLFGAAVASEARGRGVYRSLVLARWDLAVRRGTPALTVQAGRMSRPICERMGFTFVEPVRVFVDDLVE